MSLNSEHLSVSPPSAGRLVALMSAALVALAFGAAGLDYSKKEYAGGYLQPVGGELRVVAPARGIVHFEAGLNGTLAAGQALAPIRTAEALAEGGTVHDAQRKALSGKRASIQAELGSATEALQSRAQALDAQRAMAQASVAQAETEVALRKQQLVLEQQQLARQKELNTIAERLGFSWPRPSKQGEPKCVRSKTGPTQLELVARHQGD